MEKFFLEQSLSWSFQFGEYIQLRYKLYFWDSNAFHHNIPHPCMGNNKLWFLSLHNMAKDHMH